MSNQMILSNPKEPKKCLNFDDCENQVLFGATLCEDCHKKAIEQAKEQFR